MATLTSLLALIAIFIAGYAVYQRQLQPSRTFTEQFKSSNSPIVKLTSLARLLELDGRSNSLARQLGHSTAGLKEGLKTLTVHTEGEEPVHFDLSTRYDLLQTEIKAAGNIQVSRRYLDPETNAQVESFQAGQLVEVEVHIDVPEDAYFLAVGNLLPGGLEALNEGLNATSDVSFGMWGFETHRPFYWQEYGLNNEHLPDENSGTALQGFKG